MEGNPFEQNTNNPERGIEKIISLNDNGDSLIKLLHLEKLKASPENKISDDTRIIVNTRHRQFEKKIDFVESFIDGYKKEFDSNYQKYPLVDLGTDGNPLIVILAQHLEIRKGVVAVDIANQIKSEELDTLKKSEDYTPKDFSILGLKMDMLELLKQLPANSSNISMLSIDFEVLRSEVYILKLFKEIQRVVPDDGVLISLSSLGDMLSNRYSAFFDKGYATFLKMKKT